MGTSEIMRDGKGGVILLMCKTATLSRSLCLKAFIILLSDNYDRKSCVKDGERQLEGDHM